MNIAHFAAVALTLTILPTVQAATFTESTDAGQTLPTAVRLDTILGQSQPLTAISGSLSGPTDADLFQIFITDPVAFSASTIGGTVDTQLFLFSATGAGVIANDDAEDAVFQSLIPTGPGRPIGLGPIAPGVYFIGISTFGLDPRTSTNAFVFAAGTPTDLVGPNTGTLSQWGTNPFGTQGGTYTINLTAVRTVPEPISMFGVLALGMGGVFLKRRSSK